MWQDPIVQETRRLREAFAAQHDHDADTIFKAILEKQSQSPRRKVSYPSRTPDSIQTTVCLNPVDNHEAQNLR